ncbi:MAG: DNA polymerase III subunit alpha [Streptococcaceae bacterium]|jgi:DNA polymerase-3 subunit alpha|nr:DNA polymerase III subunit alpha [Streptococcaceae bacterium]
MGFALLNTKTEFSFLDSVVKLNTYLDKAVELGYETIGICDNDNLHAAYRFIKGAQKRGLQPIVGFSADFILDDLRIPMHFFALNTPGYHNLLRISTRKGFGRHAFSDLSDVLEDVAIVLPNDFSEYLPEITNLSEHVFTAAENAQQAISKRPIAFPSVRYLTAEDAPVLEVLHSIRDSSRSMDVSTSLQEVMHRPADYERYFKENAPQALANLNDLVRGVKYDLNENLHLPRFDRSRDAGEMLAEEANKGLSVLVNGDDKTYQERLQLELSVIHEMGFDDYFLIVADLMHFARESNIYCGMGRGSSAGSLVAYALGITHLDPVANHFLFERFLNPERVAMPDIDIDMPDDKRGELLAYMQRRYGTDHVAQVLTFSTFGKRQALRDVGKAFGLNEMEINQLTRSINYWGGSLTDEFEKNQRFRAEILRSDHLQQVYHFALKIEGLPRQTSLHASAVVLADEPLYHYTALRTGEPLAVTQYDAGDIEAIGLLKIDFLGLNYLSLIAKLREAVRKRHRIDIDPLKIDLEDPETLALFRAGNTEGIFQYWRKPARILLKRLQPTKFEDIAVARAIRNPGSSDFSSEFIARRHGKAEPPIIDPVLTEILAPTYGIMIYQEQVMQVTQRYAGFSLGKADLLRRAISKRKGSAEFEKLRADFIAGAKELGHPSDQASKIYDLIVKFAGFGFNRSHAYVYAALAVQLAYFKAHFPDEFYEVYLANYDRKRILVDLVENGYKFADLDINTMPYHDRVADGVVQLGLSHINGFPRDFAYWIVQNRPFADFTDFVRRTPSQWQKVESIRPLIEVGIFDKINRNRGELLANLSNLINYVTIFQLDLFAKNQLTFSFQAAEDLSVNEKYQAERELLDVAISSHPLTEWQKRLAGSYTPLTELIGGSLATVLVEVNRIRVSTDKKGAQMAFVDATDTVSPLSLVFFSESFTLNRRKIERGKMLLIKGRAELRNDEMQLKATQVIPLEETDKKLWISNSNKSKNQQIAVLLKANPGSYQVIFHNEAEKYTTQTDFYVDGGKVLLQKLKRLSVKAVFR